MLGFIPEWDELLMEVYLGRSLTDDERERLRGPRYYDNGDGRIRVEYFRPVKFPELHEESITIIYPKVKRTYHYYSLGDSDEWKQTAILEDIRK